MLAAGNSFMVNEQHTLFKKKAQLFHQMVASIPLRTCPTGHSDRLWLYCAQE